MVQNLRDLSHDLGLSLQHLTSLDVREAEGVDSIKSVEELRLGEGIFRVVLWFLERDAGL